MKAILLRQLKHTLSEHIRGDGGGGTDDHGALSLLQAGSSTTMTQDYGTGIGMRGQEIYICHPMEGSISYPWLLLLFFRSSITGPALPHTVAKVSWLACPYEGEQVLPCSQAGIKNIHFNTATKLVYCAQHLQS